MFGGAKAASYFLLINICLMVNGDYILRVRILNYSNPTNRCTFCNGMCCDSGDMTCTGTERCDNEFFFCLRPFGAAPVSSQLANSNKNNSITTKARNLGCLESPPAIRSRTGLDGMLGDFSSSVFLGLPNPLEFPVVATRWEGIHLYVDVVDRDNPFTFRENDQLVNAFNLAIQGPAGTVSAPSTSTGVLAFSSIRVIVQVVCQPGFSGPTCLRDPEPITTITTLPPETTSEATTLQPTTEVSTTEFLPSETTEVLLVETTNASPREAEPTEALETDEAPVVVATFTSEPSDTNTGLQIDEMEDITGVVAGVVTGSIVVISMLIIAIIVAVSLVALKFRKARKSKDPFNGSGDFSPDQLDNPIYGTATTGGSYALDSEAAERSLENPVYGVSTPDSSNTDSTEATYAAVPHEDRVITYYDETDTSYDAPMDADYYQIGNNDTPLSPLTPLTDGIYNFVQ